MASSNNQGGNKQSGTGNRGFASMDPDRQREIASEGGRAAHAKGTAHEFTSEEARRAGSMSHGGNQQSGGQSGNQQSGSRSASQQGDNRSGNQQSGRSDNQQGGNRSGSQQSGRSDSQQSDSRSGNQQSGNRGNQSGSNSGNR